MLSSTGGNKELQLKQGEENVLYNRFLSKDSSIQNPSFRVYYSVSTGAVPFHWEIQPGTPKRPFTGNRTTLPPLTPPPSYLHSKNKTSKPSIFTSILPKLRLRKQKSAPLPPTTLTSSSSVSSSSSSTLSSMTTVRMTRSRSRFLSWGSAASMFSAEDGNEEESDTDHESPKFVMCFGMGNIAKVASLKKSLMITTTTTSATTKCSAA